MNSKENGKEQATRLRGPGVYAAIAVVLLAAGIAGRTLASVRASRPTTTASTADTRGNGVSLPSATAAPSTTGTPLYAPSEQTQTAPQTQAVFENRTRAVTEEKTTAQNGAQRFSLPVNGGIAADYSMGIPVFSDTMGDYRTHNGVDLKAAAGTQVRAIGEGTVVSVTDDRLYGNVVTVDHGDGVVSTICGLADAGLIRSGVAVDASTVIGTVGEIPAEAKEESHVHLEVRKDGSLTDPLSLFGLGGEEE